MEIQIAEYGKVYMIKTGRPVTLEELKRIPEVVKILTEKIPSSSLTLTGIWIVKIL